MKIGVSFYYVGDLPEATKLYSVLLGASPAYADDDWARFNIEGSALGLHLDADLPRTTRSDPVQYGAVVSLSVESIHDFVDLSRSLGFTMIGEVEDLPYGLQAHLRDPWGNRLSVTQPKHP